MIKPVRREEAKGPTNITVYNPNLQPNPVLYESAGSWNTVCFWANILEGQQEDKCNKAHHRATTVNQKKWRALVHVQVTKTELTLGWDETCVTLTVPKANQSKPAPCGEIAVSQTSCLANARLDQPHDATLLGKAMSTGRRQESSWNMTGMRTSKCNMWINDDWRVSVILSCESQTWHL